MLDSIDNTYENTLKSIYNIKEEDLDLDNPFFKAIKVPGRDYIPGEEATVPEPTTDKPEIDIDQD